MQNGKRAVTSRPLGQLAQQQWPHRCSGPSQERLAITRVRARQGPLEQLPGHAKGEARLQFRAARTHDLVAKLTCPQAGPLDERRLADTCPALDHQHPTAALQQQFNCRQLTFALEQPPHQTRLTCGGATVWTSAVPGQKGRRIVLERNPGGGVGSGRRCS